MASRERESALVSSTRLCGLSFRGWEGQRPEVSGESVYLCCPSRSELVCW